MMSWEEQIARVSERRNTHKILFGIPEGKKSLGRPIRRWDNNIKMDIREIVLEGVDWIHLAENRDWCLAFVNTIMNIRIL
jgi:hypothetical protein